MNTAVINVKIEPKFKKEAQKVARDMGLSLSDLIKGYLREVTVTRTAVFSPREELRESTKRALRRSMEDVKKGWVSPGFSNTDDAIAWLNDPKAKYVRQLRKRI